MIIHFFLFGCCHFGNLKVSAAKASQDFDVRRFPEFFSFLSTRFIKAKEEDYAHRFSPESKLVKWVSTFFLISMSIAVYCPVVKCPWSNVPWSNDTLVLGDPIYNLIPEKARFYDTRSKDPMNPKKSCKKNFLK